MSSANLWVTAQKLIGLKALAENRVGFKAGQWQFMLLDNKGA